MVLLQQMVKKFLEEIIGEEDIADRVHLAGFVANAYQYLLAFDVFVLPSVKEGLPYVLLEAGAASLPVVASNVGGIPDIVSNHYSGLLVAPKNANELADRLEELLKNPELRKQFGEALHDHVQKDFSLPKMVANTAELYVD